MLIVPKNIRANYNDYFFPLKLLGGCNMKNTRTLATIKNLSVQLLYLSISILLFNSIVVKAQDSNQLSNIILKFGSTYTVEQGEQLASTILHEYASGMDDGKYRDYESMYKLISRSWAGMTIRYDFTFIQTNNCDGIVKVIEYPGNEKWESTFVFVRGGVHGWKLISYRSRKM